MLKELRAIRQALERQAPSGAMQLPVPDRTARLQVERGHIFGRPDAPLTMVEFADLQCTYCGRFTTTVFEQIRKTYIDTGVLRVVAWDFPLSIHPEALGAARATRCAGDQGKFWELRQVLLRNADHLSSTFIRKAAGELMLDMRTFDDCVASARHDADIKRDVDEARRAGVQGTPTFLLGRTVGNTVEGVLIAGAKPFEIFDARIRELAAEPSVKLDNRLDTTAARYGRPAEIAAPGSGPIRCATVRGLRHGHHGGE
jgi:protein-disulfide isomerase